MPSSFFLSFFLLETRSDLDENDVPVVESAKNATEEKKATTIKKNKSS
jgi:hypothetical protein